MARYDSFTNQYINTALWSSTDDNDQPMNQNYDDTDIDPETLARMIADCAKFQELMADYITDENLLRSPDHDTDGTYGHDFWLTRNGHGAGFWDGDYAKPAADLLTVCAKSFGEFNLYIGDDGKIYA